MFRCYVVSVSIVSILHLFHKGWATDLKTVSEEMIKKRASRTGDGTYKGALKSKEKVDGNNNVSEVEDEKHTDLWGWGKNG